MRATRVCDKKATVHVGVVRVVLLRALGVVLLGLAVFLAVQAFTRDIDALRDAQVSLLLGVGASVSLLGAFACLSRAGGAS
jgi:hypothetical protein